MRLVDLFLRKKEHDMRVMAAETAALRSRLTQLHSLRNNLSAAYEAQQLQLPQSPQQAQQRGVYLLQLRNSLADLEREEAALHTELRQLEASLKTLHGEKKALETYKKRVRRQHQKMITHKENETAYESFSHRFHHAR
jgi:chromosome segregation ATPase